MVQKKEQKHLSIIVILILQLNNKCQGFDLGIVFFTFQPYCYYIIVLIIVESTEHIWVSTTIKISSSESKTATEQRSTVSQE